MLPAVQVENVFKSQKEMPGIKAIPVPVEEEAPEAPAEPKEEKQESEEAKEEQTAQIEPAKKKRRTKAEIEKEKLEKALKKAEKEQEKVDLKARVKCPVCKKGPMSAHTLSYKHTCAESDLKKLPKAPTLEERFPEPVKKKKVVQYVPGDSDDEIPPPRKKKPKVVHSEESEDDDWPEAVPPPPPLVRQPAQMTYREILEIRRAEMQRAKAHREVGAIRAHFRR